MNLGLRTPGILKISPRGALTLWIPKSASWQQCLRTDSSILWIFRAMRILGVRGALPAFCGSVWLLEQVYSSELFSYPLMWDCRWVFSCVYPKIVFMWNLILLLDPFLPPWDGVCQSESESHSVVSSSLWPHGLYSPWNSPGQNTGVGSLSFLQGIFPNHSSNPGLPHCRRILYQLSQKGSPRILEWVAYPFASRSSRPRNQTGVSCRFFTKWAIRDARVSKRQRQIFLLNGARYIPGTEGMWISISPPTHCPQSAYLLTERETHFLIAWQPFSKGLRVDSLVLVSLNVLCTCCMTLHDAINLPEFWFLWLMKENSHFLLVVGEMPGIK